MATVFKCNGTITNPSGQSIVSATIQTSDFFSTDGVLLNRITDVMGGGVPLTWSAIDSFGTGVASTSGGACVYSATSGAAVLVLNKKIKNAGVRFKVTRIDSALATGNAFIDVRRQNGSTQLYRLGLNATSLRLLYRDAANAVTDLAIIPLALNDVVTYIANETNHKVWINGVLKADVTHTGFNGEGYVGLAKGNLTAGTAAIDEFYLYSV